MDGLKKYLLIHSLSIALCFIFFPSKAQEGYPEEYTIDYYQWAKQSLKNEKELKGDNALMFYELISTTKSSLFYNNLVYGSDSISEYLNNIAKQFVKDVPELEQNIRVYVTKYEFENAFTLPDGSVFVNIGLGCGTLLLTISASKYFFKMKQEHRT